MDKRLPAQFGFSYNNDPESAHQLLTTEHQAAHHSPLSQVKWPPPGLKSKSKLSTEDATALICNGILSFEGRSVRDKYHISDSIRSYASVAFESLSDHRRMIDQLLQVPADMSLFLFDTTATAMPWETLEHPSMSHCFGTLPGTVTLNLFSGSSNRSVPRETSLEYDVMIRQTDDLLVMQRLHYLQDGLDRDLDAAETFLFTELLLDPNWVPGVPESMDTQIVVLITALDNPIWLDFRNPAMHTLASYFDSQIEKVEQIFYQQLLLSIELYLRMQIVRRQLGESEKRYIMRDIPEKVAYDLALAQVWQSKMRFEPLDSHQNHTVFHTTATTKHIQRKKLLEFAKTMGWAGLANVEAMLQEADDGEIPLECKSSHSATWISGVLLPGPSVSWLIMRSLIDCDPEVTNDPPGFVEMYPNLGFQYDGSTYWYWQCIVGKVVGACKGVKQEYGWIGPFLSSTIVDRRCSILIHSESPINYMTQSFVKSMAARTAALGPATDSYRTDEFTLPVPNLERTANSVTFLELKLSHYTTASDHTQQGIYHASVGFAMGGRKGWIRLRYDVSFIYSPPCQGHHLLFWDYHYEIVDMVHLLTQQKSWNGISVHDKTPGDSYHEGKVPARKPEVPESILVVEAYGKEDNELLARAWASHIGFSAIVSNVKQTCMACSIRMAYAACVPMLIMTNRDTEQNR